MVSQTKDFISVEPKTEIGANLAQFGVSGAASQICPSRPFFSFSVPETGVTERSGDMVLHFRPEGVLQGLQGFFLQINIAKIVIHITDQPDAMGPLP